MAGLCFGVDVVLIALGAGGFASLIAALPGATDAIAWVGAAFLFFYGLRAFHGALKPGKLEAPATPVPPALPCAPPR